MVGLSRSTRESPPSQTASLSWQAQALHRGRRGRDSMSGRCMSPMYSLCAPSLLIWSPQQMRRRRRRGEGTTSQQEGKGVSPTEASLSAAQDATDPRQRRPNSPSAGRCLWGTVQQHRAQQADPAGLGLSPGPGAFTAGAQQKRDVGEEKGVRRSPAACRLRSHNLGCG